MCHHGYEPDGNRALSSDGNFDPCLGIMHHPSVFLLILPVPRVASAGDKAVPVIQGFWIQSLNSAWLFSPESWDE